VDHARKMLPKKGEQGFRKVLETVDGTRVCILCFKKKTIDEFVPRGNGHRGKCRPCYNERTRLKWKEVRERVFEHYGWKCVCCGETIRAFLSIDHINNDGYLDKNPNGDKKSGKELYLLVIKQNFPDKYQTLCMNCNWGKKACGICPHKTVA
jgi:hypothetical protein